MSNSDNNRSCVLAIEILPAAKVKGASCMYNMTMVSFLLFKIFSNVFANTNKSSSGSRGGSKDSKEPPYGLQLALSTENRLNETPNTHSAQWYNRTLLQEILHPPRKLIFAMNILHCKIMIGFRGATYMNYELYAQYMYTST